MAAPIDLRNDFDSVSLRRLAKRTRDATQSRRLLALAEVYDGGSRTDASRIGGVGLQIIRDWVLRFNARGPDGLVDGKSPGAPSKLNADHRRALAEVVEAGPVPAVDGVVRWRRKDLARWLLETFAISLDETTVGRELKALGFAKISARPRHYAQNELAVEAFKKNFPAELAKIRARLPKGVEIELWWQDEARIGQKNKLTRRWARRGTRPRAPRDQRTEWAYIFGAICPAKGKGAGLVMPWCDTDAMAAHLIEISAAVDPGAHAVLIVDQAGWHLTPKLAIPDNITVLALPPRSPELNPVGECLAIHARQLVVEPDLQILRRHRRAVLPSLEQPHRPTMEDHVPRHAQMGAWVLINDRWYQTTVAKYMSRGRRPPSQSWKTFLRNHAECTASIDFFVVPTATCKLLFGLLIIRHERRQLIHVAVTANPTADWIARQISEAFPGTRRPPTSSVIAMAPTDRCSGDVSEPWGSGIVPRHPVRPGKTPTLNG